MKNITEYYDLIEKEISIYKKNSDKILAKIEKKFNKGDVVATHHFNNSSPELVL